MSEWISVEERLPDVGDCLGELFLCHHVSGKWGQLSWMQIDWFNGVKFIFKKDGKHDHVTHWMPLPELPKEGEAGVQTNADRLRAMTDEELARFINFTTCCANCPAKRSCPENYALPDKCVSSLLSWLKAPVKVDE